jgi:hypothetical protein
MTERAEGEPWEQPGAMRRDVEPDRGPTLLLLAGISLALGVLSLITFLPCVVAVPLGLGVEVAAGRDLKKMRFGRMAPGGQSQIHRALSWASLGVGLGLLPLTVVVVFAGLLLAQWLFSL